MEASGVRGPSEVRSGEGTRTGGSPDGLLPLGRSGRGVVGYLAASANDHIEERPNFIQKRVRHPSFYIALPVAVMAGSFLGFTTEMAPPADQDFHNSSPYWPALAVVSPSVILSEWH